jgi:hypothetical protein
MAVTAAFCGPQPGEGCTVVIWKGVVRVYDANAMIGELVMHLGDVHFLHVAGNAILSIRRAWFAGMIGSLLFGGSRLIGEV